MGLAASMEGFLTADVDSVCLIGILILLMERAPLVYYPDAPPILKALLLPNIIIFEDFLFSNTCFTICSFYALVSSEDYSPLAANVDTTLCFFY